WAIEISQTKEVIKASFLPPVRSVEKRAAICTASPPMAVWDRSPAMELPFSLGCGTGLRRGWVWWPAEAAELLAMVGGGGTIVVLASRSSGQELLLDLGKEETRMATYV
ncbi:hypothetical protein Dimus_036259, partial [Dionaea muscipula]